jgi:hypothetical protein
MSMVECTRTERRTNDVPAMTIRGRFRGYKPEAEKASRKAEVKENEALTQLKAVWKDWQYHVGEGVDGNYRYISRIVESSQIVENLQYTEKDVEDFSIIVAEFQDDYLFSVKAGIFLSALINYGDGKDFVIQSRHLMAPPDYLGYLLGHENEKNVIVDGDIGNGVGLGMICGSIIVKGNADSSVGMEMKSGSIIVSGDVGHLIGSSMKGGSIVVGGNAGGIGDRISGGDITVNGDIGIRVGYWMKGGSITVKGNVGRDVGEIMTGGTINLEGNYESLSDRFRSGRIYHKGILIAGE